MYVCMSIYLVRPQGAAVWHNHDSKSDQLISYVYACVYVYISYIYTRFSPRYTQLLRRLYMRIIPRIYIRQKTPTLNPPSPRAPSSGSRLCRGWASANTRLPIACARFPTGLPRSGSCEPRTPRTRSTTVRVRKIQIVLFS